MEGSWIGNLESSINEQEILFSGSDVLRFSFSESLRWLRLVMEMMVVFTLIKRVT